MEFLKFMGLEIIDLEFLDKIIFKYFFNLKIKFVIYGIGMRDVKVIIILN